VYNNIVTDYKGTITFSSSDSAATLPSDYTFSGAEGGVVTLGSVIFQTPNTAPGQAVIVQTLPGILPFIWGEQKNIVVCPATGSCP